MNKKILIISLVIVSILLFGIFFLEGFIQGKVIPAEKIEESKITVNFSAEGDQITHVASGFLFNPKSPTWPPSEIILPLRLRHVRNGAEYYFQDGIKEYLDEVLKVETKTLIFSAGVIILPSGEEYWPGDKGDWEPYRSYLTKIILEAQRRGYELDYEIWNEPNGVDKHWSRDDKRFFETWTFAYRLIKELEPDAIIVGPAAANFYGMTDNSIERKGSGRYTEEFLIYAKENNVVPNILSWHELNVDPEVRDGNINPNPKGGATNIVSNVEYARQLIKDLNLTIEKIYINEYIPDYAPDVGLSLNEKFNGAFAIQYFSALEEAKVDAALRVSWRDFYLRFPRPHSCRDLLCSLITPDGKPRSNWYVYKAYAEMQGKIVQVESQDGISGFATINEDEKIATLLMGTTNPIDKITINLTGLAEEFGLDPKLTIEEVKYSYRDKATQNTINPEYILKNQTIIINLTSINEGNIYLIKIKAKIDK